MKVLNKRNQFLLLVILCIIGLAQIAWAQSGGVYKISKSTNDAGGGVTQGGIYKVSSSIGQTNASSEITGGVFSLTGGYWSTLERSKYIFEDGFEGL